MVGEKRSTGVPGDVVKKNTSKRIDSEKKGRG